jgi:hypothetical protein
LASASASEDGAEPDRDRELLQLVPAMANVHPLRRGTVHPEMSFESDSDTHAVASAHTLLNLAETDAVIGR